MNQEQIHFTLVITNFRWASGNYTIQANTEHGKIWYDLYNHNKDGVVIGRFDTLEAAKDAATDTYIEELNSYNKRQIDLDTC